MNVVFRFLHPAGSVRRLLPVIAGAGLVLFFSGSGHAQAPVPGANVPAAAPLPGQAVPTGHAPVPGVRPGLAAPGKGGAGAPQSGYDSLPISLNDAQNRINELNTLLPHSRPQALQKSVYELVDWLTDMALAHNKLAKTFSKHAATKEKSEAEKRAFRQFSNLKNKAQLLKAKILIKQRRFPEALVPLVDIVNNEPTTGTGVDAYKLLEDIGFAEKPAPPPEQPASDVTEEPADAPARQAADQKPRSINHKTPASEAEIQLSEAKEATAAPANRPKVKAMSTVRRSSTPAIPSTHPTVWISGTPTGGR